MNAMRPLLELLGARWAMDAPVVGVAWDGAAHLAGFGLGDGTLAIARDAWDGGPQVTEREAEGIEIVPARQPPPPVPRTSLHRGAILSVVADPAGGFLTGGDDGAFVRSNADGERNDIAAFATGTWVDLAAAARDGFRACATGRQVHRFAGTTSTPEVLDLPSLVTALAFDPLGRTLAAAHHGGVTLWADNGSAPRPLAWQGTHRAVAWSPDGAYLVTGMQENALHGWRVADGGDIEMGGYPGQPHSLSFSADGQFLATSGAASVICWRFDPPGVESGPSECGIASRIPVSVVACHPQRPVVAAGYHNGAVLLCQPGSTDVLFVRAAGGGTVTALAWSDDGRSLALGTEGGEIGVVAFPARMFRAGPADAARGGHAA